MDPTKSFDHLDPKLKETYARVMGTNTSGTNDAAQNTPALPPTPSAPFAPTQNQFGTSPLSPTPPTDTAAAPFSQPAAPLEPVQTANSPENASFFSNPSPVDTNPTQAPVENGLSAPIEPPAEPAPTPVTPYMPENFAANQNGLSADQFPQPFPSPSSVNQSAPHEASALLKVLYIIGAVIFLAVYTVFWIKVFNLPFLF